MFGNSKPFGTATAFGGGTTFGSTTPFGQTTTGFGAKPATGNVFGSSTFGTQPTNSGLFGQTAQPAGGGLFGQTTNTFGTPASTSTGSFGFGATPSTGGLFGSTSTPTMQNSGGLFGSSQSAFGAPRPAFGGFGNTNTGGLFGQNQAPGTSLFGASGFTSTTQTGTTIKFNPPTGTDTMMKGGVSTSIGTRHQCITCMKEYENKSLEELRAEDYAAGRKGGTASATGMTFGTTTQQTGLFGQTPAASTSGFNFGNNTQSSFGTSNSLFGQPAQSTGAGLFGKPTGFGTATTSAAPVFSFGTQNSMGGTNSLFGQNNQAKPLFGQTTTTGGLFGNTATTQQSGFGSTTGFGAFGSTTPQTGGLFGNKPGGFGTSNTTTTNSFTGFGTNTTGSLFGQKTTTPAFGTTTGFGGTQPAFGNFGGTTTTGTSLFGQNKPATSMFGGGASTFGSGLSGNTFGTSTFNTLGTGLGTSTGGIFGTNTANKAPGFIFGGTGSTGYNFGGGANTSTFNFNPTSSLMGVNDPNSAAALQQAQQQILAMTTNPFGDSPLFRNPIKDSSRETEVLKPTNPTAQKALLNDSQYKVTLLPTAKIKPKPWSPSPNGKTFLFDGLEDEEPSLGQAAFMPKKSVKKLVLKNIGANRSSFTVTSDLSGSSSQNNTRIDVSISLNKSDQPSSSVRVFSDTSSSSVPLTVDNLDKGLKNTTIDKGPSMTERNQKDLHKSASDTSISLSPESSLRRPSIDDSIAALHTKKTGLRGARTFNVLSESEEDIEGHDVSSEDDLYPNSASTEDHLPPSKTGVILTRPEYYTIPSLEELTSYLDENGNCYIGDFTIGRTGFGKVTFPGQLNVAGLNLDDIVHFRKKEINVYPDDNKKPPIGEELNRKAVVTLENVWPTDKTNHSPIRDPDRLNVMGYREKIERSTARLGAKFLDYIPETGSWIFQVEHFSKYGLEDSDEEMDVAKPPENKQIKIPHPLGQLSKPLQPPQNEDPHQQILTRKPISSQSIDDDMGGIPFSIQSPKDFLFQDDEDFTNEVYSPTRPLFSTNVDAERIQGMKASFFQEMEEDSWGSSAYQPSQDDLFAVKKPGDLQSFSFSKDSSRFNSSMESFAKKQRFFDYVDKTHVPPALPTKGLDTGIHNSMSSLSLSQAKQMEWMSEFPLVKNIPQQPVILKKQSQILNKIRLQPLLKSVLNGKELLFADAGYFMGRRFRPGWRSDGTLIALQPPEEISIYSDSFPKFLLYGDKASFTNKNTRSSGFTLTLHKINAIQETDQKTEILKKHLVQSLELQLDSSLSTIETDSPLFVPKPGVEILHSHAKLFQEQVKSVDPLSHDISFKRQCVNVWNLLVSLWGKVRDLDNDQTPSSYTTQMARREALSSWLIKASETSVMKEIAKLSQDKYLTKIFLYLSCRRISDAVQLAQEHQDFRLSLLLSNAEGNATIRKWLCSQLLNWEQNGAYKFIKYDRLMLYAVLAGLLYWENHYEVVNCCKNIDWKQALALHLWYQCEANSSIQVAVEEYDKSFTDDSDQMKYSLPPYPPYTQQELLDDVDMDKADTEKVYDTCYHLLKLYCNRAHRFDQLLMPHTYTTDPLDYRLSWLLHLALSSVGFNIPVDLSCTLHMNFASQLEAVNLWQWSIFVYLHYPDIEWRTKNVKDVLLRHVSLTQDETTEDIEQFLKIRLQVPEKWIYEAKAIKAHSMGKHAEEAWFLLKAGFWNKSHSIVIKHLASDAVINEYYDYLLKYLSEFSAPERCSTISDWASGGQVYLDYINMCQVVQNVVLMETSAYDLEKFTPQVVSLCNRLSSIPISTLKDRLSVAEMAKKTATIMRSIAMLQASRTKNNNSLISLASYIKNLPMPHDYAAAENRFITHCFLKEVTSEAIY